MTDKSSDFLYEEKHLAGTLDEMKQIVKALENDIDNRVHQIRDSVSIKDEISAYVHSLMKSDNAAKIYDIERAFGNPYFGRVDFKEDEADEFEVFYIGRTKITRLTIDTVKDILVFDWRDPVSTVFYECHDGRATYDVQGRYVYSGDVRLKRQFKIEEGRLLAMSDDNIVGKIMARQEGALIADPFLLERLLQGASDRLKDIVTSIRSEQNRIIRESINQVTVIQGVAGSGKSTIGLHRLSFLLYNEKLKADRLVVIAPNRIFLDYISDLLPEIDAQDVKQMTFQDLAVAMMQVNPVISKEDTSWIWLDKSPANSKRREQLAGVVRWKGSPDFIGVMESFAERKLEKFCLKLKDIMLFDGQLVITKEQQLDKIVDGANVPYNERLRSLQKYLRFRVKNFVEVLEARNERGDRGISDKLVEAYRKEGDTFTAKHSSKWPFLDLLSGYAEVFRDIPAWKSVKKKNVDIEFIASHSLAILQDGQIEQEDLAPLCCFKSLIDGLDHIEKFDHIVVDEGQDLNLLEYQILRRLSRNTSFTIMGDMLQGIYAQRGLDSWQVLLKEVFGDDKWRYHEVNYSYRSAKEIVDFFNRVMPEGRTRAIPVYEIGFAPLLESADSDLDGLHKLAKRLDEYVQKGCKSIGILTREEQDAEKVCEGLKRVAPHLSSINLVTRSTAAYQGGITVAPVMLAKGLEFDGVVLWNASDKEFSTDPYDAKLLYVALSRAMYYLTVFYQGRLTPLLRE